MLIVRSKKMDKNLYMTNSEYRKSKGISASDIKQILNEPYLFKLGIKPEFTPAQQAKMNLGSAIHSLVIEPQNFERDFLVLPNFNLRSAKDRGEKEKLCSGEKRIALTPDTYERAKKVANSLLETNAGKLFQNGVGEISLKKEIDGVVIKCRPDFFMEEQGLIIDLKTTGKGGASPDAFAKTIASLQYYIQASVYLEVSGASQFVFVVIETEPPYQIGIYDLDKTSLDFGKSEMKRAIEIYKNLAKITQIVSKDFDSETSIKTLTLPNYVYYRDGAKTLM